jgi:DNA (cytosine-5)-methyltransferase 3A
MNVLSLFDGISCGRIALERADIPVTNYYSSEIDKKAISVAQDNYPDTIQIGDVTGLKRSNLPEVDLLIGGSPCQGFSMIGKNLAFNDPRSKLFFEFVRLLKETKPKYFLLENVKMKKEYINIISSYLGVFPRCINSSLVSAQSRVRYYWTNIPHVEAPADLGITLKDVIDHKHTGYRVPNNWQKRVPAELPMYVDPYNKKAITSGKSTSLRTNVNNGNMWVKVSDGYRNLSRHEAEALQTVPKDYTRALSDNQAKKCLGNGWTVDVLAHIFKEIGKGDA